MFNNLSVRLLSDAATPRIEKYISMMPTIVKIHLHYKHWRAFENSAHGTSQLMAPVSPLAQKRTFVIHPELNVLRLSFAIPPEHVSYGWFLARNKMCKSSLYGARKVRVSRQKTNFICQLLVNTHLTLIGKHLTVRAQIVLMAQW